MSSTDTCEYEFDPDDFKTRGGKEGEKYPMAEKWSCPHKIEGEAEDENGQKRGYCIFHLPVNQKDDKEVIEEFRNVVEMSTASGERKRKPQFVAAKFGEFDLDESLPNHSNADGSIIMSFAEFKQEVDFSEVTFERPAEFPGATFEQGADFLGATFEQGADFLNAEFRMKSRFGYAEFKEKANFFNAEFNQEVSFRNADFKRGGDFSQDETNKYKRKVDFSYACFEERADFFNREFEGEANFEKATFEKNADFDCVKFKKKVDFNDATFAKNADFQGAKFSEDEGKVNFSKVDFEEDALFSQYPGPIPYQESVEFDGEADFSEAVFSEKPDFSDTQFNGKAVFTDTEFSQGADFSGRELVGSRFNNTDLTDVTLTDANLKKANLEEAILTRTTLLKTDLRGAQLSDTVLADVRVNEKTQFLGHHSNDSDSSSYTPSAILSTPKCVYDPQYDKSTSGRFIPLMVFILVSSLSLFNVNQFIPLMLSILVLSLSLLIGLDIPVSTLVSLPFFVFARSAQNVFPKGEDSETNIVSSLGSFNVNQFIPLMVFVLLLSLSLFNGLDILVSTLVSLPVSVFAQSAQNVFSKGEDSEANNSESTDIDDRRKAKTVYRALEDVGRNNARPRLQRQCFIRRKDIQRKEYWKDAKEIDSHTQTFIAGCYWFKARISRLTMLHGESPWRVIGTSSVIVLVFGILYSLVGGIAVTNEGVTYAFDMPQLVSIPVPNWAATILMNLYFSVVTFTTLGYGDIQPSNAATRALAGVESLLGAALIALLVFVLGRRATR